MANSSDIQSSNSPEKEQAPRMRCLFFFCRPIRGISPGESSRRLASLGSHIPHEVTRLKQLSIVLAEESPKQGVGRAEKTRRQTTTMRRRVDRASVPHNETFTRRNEQILANSRHRRDAGSTGEHKPLPYH